MSNEQEFKAALKGKKIPILVLDQKWHRLFAIHGKPDVVQDLETEINSMIAREGKLNNEQKELQKIKNQLMDSIVKNMDGTTGEAGNAFREKKLDEDKRLINEVNAKIEANEDELLELPGKIKEANEQLMLESMDYFYEKLRINSEEAKEIEDWITQVRIDLKKNIIRKQNREVNNKEMYAYLHDIFGPDVLNLFDLQYEEEQNNPKGDQSK
jgi:hypothetical protein